MNMQMVDWLAALHSIVDHQSVAFIQAPLLGHFPGNKHQMSQNLKYIIIKVKEEDI